jgi:murein L,D-transpeptidase YcbB/YkuD
LLSFIKGVYNKQCDSLLTILKNAEDFGLLAKDYHFSKIDSLIKTEKDTTTQKFDAVKIEKAEILLTDAFFTFAVHVSKGRLDVDSIQKRWNIDKVNINLPDVLTDALKKNSIQTVIDTIQPKEIQYHDLKLALKNFREEFHTSNWDSLASRESDSLTFNDRLKKRLIASHDYNDTSSFSDSIKLANAIKFFQQHHNLNDDGKMGKLTFQAMQNTKTDYIHQIEMNMERWRIYRYPTDKQFVFVNIPKFEMRVIEEDTMVMESRVIVGQPDHKTPLLKSTIRYFLIYPYWNVPFSIATKEILPILKRDTSYLRRKNFDVLDGYGEIVTKPITWKRYSKTYFPFRLRQRMGDDNSLGILKFNFENKYGVYMHDTDSRRLFKREMRALSHGCVRLEKFIDFAKFLIRDDSVKYPFDSLKIDLLKEEQKYKYIKHPLPIYINYFTAEVNKQNELLFFMDVYRRDEKMLEVLGY